MAIAPWPPKFGPFGKETRMTLDGTGRQGTGKPALRRLGNGLRRFVGLAGPDRRLIQEALVQVMRAQFEVWFGRFNRMQTSFGARCAVDLTLDPDGQETEAQKVATQVQRVARTLPWDVRCLVRAAAVKRMLGKRGISAVLVIGVAPSLPKAGTNAHAWITKSGRVLIGGGLRSQGFTPLVAYC